MKQFRLFMAGAEVPKWWRLLADGQVENVGVNYLYLRERLPKPPPWTVEGEYPKRVLLDSGAVGISKKEWSPEEHEAYLSEYMEFVQAQLPQLTYVTECDFLRMGYDWIAAQRRDFWDHLPPEKFIPIWHPEFGHSVLRVMLDQYANVGIPPLSKSIESRVGGLVRRSRAHLHGLGFSHPFDVPGGLYNTILSASWISPTRYGETQVWDHNRMRRYPSDDKVAARRRHRSQFMQAGFDAEAIAGDNGDELARYTIWAWQQLQASMDPPERIKVMQSLRPRPRVVATNGHVKITRPSVDFGLRGVDTDVAAVLETLSDGKTDSNHHDEGKYLPALPSDVIPGFSFRTVKTLVPDPEGGDQPLSIDQQVPVLADTPTRQCDSCSLAGTCPAFEPGSACKFRMPIQIQSRDQLLASMKLMLEMQAQRVAFGRFSEELNGGYPDQNLSMEIDRFYKLVNTFKNIEDNRDVLSLHVEARGQAMAQAGMLTRLFGMKATEPLRQVDPDAAEGVLRDAME